MWWPHHEISIIQCWYWPLQNKCFNLMLHFLLVGPKTMRPVLHFRLKWKPCFTKCKILKQTNWFTYIIFCLPLSLHQGHMLCFSCGKHSYNHLCLSVCPSVCLQTSLSFSQSCVPCFYHHIFVKLMRWHVHCQEKKVKGQGHKDHSNLSSCLPHGTMPI